MEEARRYLALFFFLGEVFLRRLITYRVDFLIGVGSFTGTVIVQVLTLFFIFQHIELIENWNYYEILFLFGFSLIPRGLDHSFTDQLWELGRKLIQRGEFYKYLIRPVNPLFNLVSERFFYPDGLGEMFAGIAIVIYAGGKIPIDMSIGKAAFVVVLVLCSTVIYTAIKLFFASLAFWTITSLPMMTAVYQFASFSKYPLDIYHQSIRFILSWIVPFAFTAYFPVTYILFNRIDLALWTPVVACVSLFLAYQLWLKGLDSYEATGS
jgi:ABC-2 type transport system permease protein